MTIEVGSFAEIERALILGLARQPLPVPDALAREDDVRSRLGYLALVAARRRFERPAPPGAFPPADESARQARHPDWGTRVRLRRLFADGSAQRRVQDEALALRVRDALRAHGLSVHPFDVPVLRAFLRAGATEEESPPGTDDWAELSPKARARALAALRRTDPEGARALCAAELADQTAAVRKQWLAALETSLGPADVEFLEAQLNDRAASVVERATGLLARIPGTRWFDERLAEARSRLRKKSGLLRRQAQLELETPAHLRAHQRWDWVRSGFAGIAPAALAASLDVPVEELPRAIDDADLRRALYLASIDAHDAPLAEALSSSFDATDLDLVLDGGEGGGGIAGWDEAQLDLAARTIMPAGVLGDPLSGSRHARQFYQALRRTLPEARASELLAKARRWERHFRDCADAELAVDALLAWLTVLPASLRPRAVDAADALPGPHRREVLDFHALLEGIEKRD